MSRAHQIAAACLCVSLAAGCDASEPPREAIDAPRLDGAEKMSSGLHVAWTNPPGGCDAVEIERRVSTNGGEMISDFALLFTVGGVVDNKHDGSATEDLVYLLHGEGVETGIDLEALISVAAWLEELLGRPLEGQVYRAGNFPPAP